jgi:hypothetical protein
MLNRIGRCFTADTGEKMTYFPIKIQLTPPTGEFKIIKTPKEIPNGIPFRVLETATGKKRRAVPHPIKIQLVFFIR